MTDSQSNEGSVRGQGASIMLPPRGNPFGSAPGSVTPEDVLPAGAETAPTAEPQDLSPEDIAALFPTSHSDRDAAMADAPSPALASLGADLELPEHPLAEAPGIAEAAPRMSAEDLAALYPSAHVERGLESDGEAAPEADALPAGARVMPDVPITAPGMAIPSTTVAGGQALPGSRAFSGELQLSDSAGPAPDAFQRTVALPGQESLVNMFVPDERLVALWANIDSTEGLISSTPGVSLRMARELLDRLATARNLLMNDRTNFEEAERELAEVKYRLARLARSSASEGPRVILLYLLLFLAAVVVGFLTTGTLAERISAQIAGEDFGLVWTTVLWGGIGGITGALYGLWRHVARDQDYDPQYAMWYYTNPLMGLILGAFVFLVVRAGVLAFFSASGQDVQTSPYLLYVLAWAVGFQQNLAFSLANALLKRIIPKDERSAGADDVAAASAEKRG